MTSYRNTGSSAYSIGSEPPTITWTVVSGDTASFRVYVEDDDRNPLDLSTWTLAMDIIRPSEDNDVIVSLTPTITEDDDATGSFTVSLSSSDSQALETDDEFDIQISDTDRVWTLAKGKMIIIDDITADPTS
ncbi:MAG: hypothetical protein EBY03_07035 [Actinobacteria bacterium]|jgi:hypothetical protein|nr:hypothetical protein [Actinomycetota bacterium]